MDWYAWLCRTGLDPDVALEYALLFARNELGAADVRHLDHAFLATMGVAVAKHRLEILKLARRETSAGRAVAAAITALPRRATRLLAAAAHRSARSVLGRLRCSSSSTPRGRDKAAALVGAPPARYRGSGGGGRVAHCWTKVASPLVTHRGKRPPPLPLPMLTFVSSSSSKPGPVLTYSGSKRRNSTATAAIAGCLAAPEVSSCDEADEDEMELDGDETDDGEEEDVQWESMFQDLKPT
ncbi:hypothetical protein QOZ80_6BG0463030 [Eleusine coracana subsp. coracana]|nr:hypothetical protein QOZ80_6BG0463030 [Eleusine coracana subsp. coracana]